MQLIRSFQFCLVVVAGFLASTIAVAHVMHQSDEPIALYSEIKPVKVVEKNKGKVSADELQLELTAYGRSIILDLRSNERLVEKLKGHHPEIVSKVYAGKVREVADSWARVTKINGGIKGAFFDGNEFYFLDLKESINFKMLDRLTQRFLKLSKASTVIYKSADIESQVFAELQGMQVPKSMSGDAPPGESNGDEAAILVPPTSLGSAGATHQLNILIVADAEYIANVGGDAVNAIISQMNIVDGIYSSQLGVHINIDEIRPLSNNGFLTATQSLPLLQAFEDYIQSTGGHPGAAHLFSGKDLLDGANNRNIGRGRQDSLCGQYATGVTEAAGVNGLNHGALFVAHELAHNFGAEHDDNRQICPVDPGDDFLMAPSIKQTATQFSQCSIDQIIPKLDTKQCIILIPSDIPFITSTPSTFAALGAIYNYDSDRAVNVNGADPLTYILNIAPDGMTISDTGVLNWIPQFDQLGEHPVELFVTNSFGSDTQNFSIRVSENSIVDFNQYPLSPYIFSEDQTGTAVVEDGGASVHLTGNRWVKVDLPYTVTPNTVLAFDFSSNVQGEIHGIGLASNQTLDTNIVFKVHGTQNIANQTFDNYAGGTQRYTIQVGQFYNPGDRQFLFFVMDHDNGAIGQSVFSNVQVYEDIPEPPPGVAPTITSTASTSAVVGKAYTYDADNRAEADGTNPVTYNLATAPAGMTISTDGVVTWTPDANQEGPQSVEIVASNAFGADSQNFIVVVSPAPSNDVINFDQYPLSPYVLSEDRSGTVVVDGGGAEVRLTGNRWVKIDFPYTVTSNTVLAFDFSSSVQGEIHGIGLATDQALNTSLVFKVYGTQNIANQTYNNYPGFGTQRYEIPVGQFYNPGDRQFLFFVMDHDNGAFGESVFSNVQVYEDVPEPPPGVAPRITSVPTVTGVVGIAYQYDADGSAEADGSNPITYSLAEAPDGMTMSANGVLTWTPGVDQQGSQMVEIVATNAFGSDTQSFAVTVSPAPSNDVVNFDQNPLTPYVLSEDQSGTVVVEAGGATARLTGNRWVKVGFPYTVTPDTVLAFDFSSGVQGEIHGIGLANNQTLNTNIIFKVHGTQNIANQTFDNYIGGTQRYVIPIGQFYSPGDRQFLFFVMDHDSGAFGESVFSNVIVYEDVPLPPGTAPQITSTPGTSAEIGSSYLYDADNTVESSGTDPITYSLAVAPTGMTISDQGVVDWTPVAGQEGLQPVEIIAMNAFGSNAQSFNIDVVAQPPVGTAPEITSTPSTSAEVGSAYLYDADSKVEASGTGPISYSLAAAPTGMTISDQGVVDWTPVAGQEGLQPVEIIAMNAFGSNAQSFNIDVAAQPPVGTAPQITSTPNTNAVVGSVYEYDADSTVEAAGTGPITYSLINGPVGMTVNNDGIVNWTPGSGQEGLQSVEVGAANAFGSNTQNFSVLVSPMPSSDSVNFQQNAWTPYVPSEDQSGTVSVENSGATLRLTGNRWVKVDLPYNVTANTVIEFDFSSSRQGEIHGIGLAFNQGLDTNLIFKVYGTQNIANQTFNNYSGSGIQRFTIPVGQFYEPGERPYLFFVMDHDNGATGESVFSNVRIYEDIPEPPPPAPPQITSTPGSTAVLGSAYVYDSDNRVEALGTGPITFSLNVAPDGMTISDTGLISWLPYMGQEGSHPVEIMAINSVGAATQNFAIDVSSIPVINFTQNPLSSYIPSEDQSGTVTVENGGASVRITGNRWVKIDLPYEVTANTVIEFDFSSNRQGEIHGIGMASNQVLLTNRIFKVYGTQNIANQTFNNYPGFGAVHYTIPIGQFYSGQQQYLFFVMDHDSGANGESLFSNVQVYEDVPAPPPGIPPQITSSPNNSATVGLIYEYDADSQVEADGTGPITFSLGSGPTGMVVSSDGLVTWTPSPSQEGVQQVEIVASNAFGSDTQTFDIDVSAAPSDDVISFLDYPLSPYVVTEDQTGSIAVEGGGATVRITGNRWVKIDLPYTVTPNTVLEFEFSSSQQGEIHGIGLASNQSLSVNRIFKVYGTQSIGIQNYNNYSGSETRRYVIPVGAFYGAIQTQFLFFVMDHDVGASGESVFSNVKLYEQ